MGEVRDPKSIIKIRIFVFCILLFYCGLDLRRLRIRTLCSMSVRV